MLAIDDMRDPGKYEAYLRPILNRLKQIDGPRAPVSIMTNKVDASTILSLPNGLAEGLSLDVHTIDHPCPLLYGGDFAKAKSTYDRCVDLMNEIPGNKPVAFRMPCCDSLNTVSPRFYSEIFNKRTDKGNYLSISSSVFNLCTPNDPDIPRELVLDPDGRDKFRKYLPKGQIREGQTSNTFVNYIEDYPYPYVIDRLCWEFPCVVPSDWSAQHLQKPYNPDTVRDLKAALDITVLKQGVYNLVFHPHNWIKPEQVVEIIDHAVAKHGKKVKFLTFREALERLNANVLGGSQLRQTNGRDNGVRAIDVNNDGFMDFIIGNQKATVTRMWSAREQKWVATPFPSKLIQISGEGDNRFDLGARFGIWSADGFPSVALTDSFVSSNGGMATLRGYHFSGTGWTAETSLQVKSPKDSTAKPLPAVDWLDHGVRFYDLDNDGRTEVVISNPVEQSVKRWSLEKTSLGDAPVFAPCKDLCCR